MLANFFGKSKPVNFIVLFVLFLVYFSLSLFSKELSFNLLKELLGFTVVFSIFNFILAKNKLTFDNSYAFLFFILLIGLFSDVIIINNTFFAFLTTLLFLRKVYSLQSPKNTLHKLFDGGLWLGVSFILEPYSVFFGILLYISIYLHQQYNYQTLLSPLIGFSSVVFLFFTYCFWYDQIQEFYQLFDWSIHYDLKLHLNSKYIFQNVLITFFVLLVIILKSPKALSVLNTFRKNWILTIVNLATSLLIILLTGNNANSELLFVFFPSAIILANGLELYQHKKIADIFLFLFLLGSIAINVVWN